MTELNRIVNWGPVREGASTSPYVSDWRYPPPPANRVVSTVLVLLFMPARAAISKIAARRNRFTNWGPVRESASTSSPHARGRWFLPPPAGRVGSAAPGLSFIRAPNALMNWGSVRNCVSPSPLARDRRHLPPLTGRVRNVARVLTPLKTDIRLGNRRKAVFHLPHTHKPGGPSPHLPAVLEALCRFPFLLPLASRSPRRSQGGVT